MSFKASTLLYCVFGDIIMLCYRILLLFAMFFMVIMMPNTLFATIIKLIFKEKKILFGRDFEHFLLKVRLASKKFAASPLSLRSKSQDPLCFFRPRLF